MRLTRRALLVGLGAALAGAGRAVLPVRASAPPEPAACPEGRCQEPLEMESNLAETEAVRLAAVDIGNVPNLLTRVDISNYNFLSLEHDEVQVTADGTFDIFNQASGTNVVSAASAGKTYSATYYGGWLRLRALPEDVQVGVFTGPLLVRPHDHNLRVRLANVSRGSYGPATYRGYIELRPLSSGKVSVVNVLAPDWFADPLERYLYGVLPVEMPTDYGLEALKAQAVAARCYAASKWNGSAVSLCDSTHCQVYYGYSVEQAASNDAVNATRGVVATVGGQVINAMYHAICGGHTEHNDNVYTTGSPVSYLRGVRCYDDGSWADLSQEGSAATFWQGAPASFCDWSTSLYRWTRSWDRDTLAAIINTHLPTVPSSHRPQSFSGDVGELYELRAVQRGVSGKIRQLRIVNRAGASWDVYSDYWIRHVLRSSVGSGLQFSSNLVFTHSRASDGALLSVVAYGGGWGHGVGLCQRGARGMASRGYDFAAILRHYYSGITLNVGPSAPPAPLPQPPLPSHFPPPTAPVTLAWQGSATEYFAVLQGPGVYLERGWSSATSWTVGPFALGAYQWRVRGRNVSGGTVVEGPYCAWQSFVSIRPEDIHRLRLPLVPNNR
ncbi:MAG: SpoIID/LytB domain-containing protein [Chloroflexota bacterium]